MICILQLLINPFTFVFFTLPLLCIFFSGLLYKFKWAAIIISFTVPLIFFIIVSGFDIHLALQNLDAWIVYSAVYSVLSYINSSANTKKTAHVVLSKRGIFMNLFEKILLYILSFIFSPIGIITWIISLFSKDPEKKQVGRICLYIALISFILLAGLGILSFFTMTTTTIQ